MRLIASRRISRQTSESVSIETQGLGIEQYCQAYGHEIVGWTEDASVSGAVPIRERPGMGAWLGADRLGDWDGVIGYKLDRLFRSQADYVAFYQDFCQGHGKVIISAGEQIDTSTEVGKFIADLLVAFAEMERGRMRTRRREAADRIRKAGRWNGGQVPFGWKPVQNGSGWTLAHSEHAEVARDMAKRVIAGESLSAVARGLRDAQVPTPRENLRKKGDKPYEWWPATVRGVLRSRSLLGESTHAGAVVRGDDGRPLRYGEPLLGPGEWELLQAALDAAGNPLRGARSDGAYLLRVAFCECGEPLWLTNAGNGRKYYRCRSRTSGKSCGNRSTKYEDLNDIVTARIGDMLKGMPWTVTVRHPGADHTQEMTEIGQAIRDLGDEHYVRRVISKDEYQAKVTALQSEYDRLAELPDEPGWTEEIPTGQMSDEVWNATEGRERTAILQRIGIRAYVAHPARGDVRVTLKRPPENWQPGK